MKPYFLGVDVGGTKTRALIAAENGHVVGFGVSGPGNHEGVGYAGLIDAMQTAIDRALAIAGLSKDRIDGAGFGVAGYDWPNEREQTLQAIRALGLAAPVEAVNDTLIGLLAGSPEGWGVAVVAGTGCNCRGWDRSRRREGMVTGAGMFMGEGAGSVELVMKAIQAVSYEWTKRERATRLTPALVELTGAGSAALLLEGLIDGRIQLDASAAPVIFRVAAEGDPVANELICWAGTELGELALCVIRQLEFEPLEFDVVLLGSMFAGSPVLAETMGQRIQTVAPGARLVHLNCPPVIGAVLLGMEAAGISMPGKREALIDSFRSFR